MDDYQIKVAEVSTRGVVEAREGRTAIIIGGTTHEVDHRYPVPVLDRDGNVIMIPQVNEAGEQLYGQGQPLWDVTTDEDGALMLVPRTNKGDIVYSRGEPLMRRWVQWVTRTPDEVAELLAKVTKETR